MSGNETGPEANGDVVAEVYHGRHFDPATQRAGRERIHWICSKARGDHVLDIGCSQGIACLLLAREGVRCTGVDTQADAIAYAQAEAAKEPAAVQALLDYRQADGTRLEFEDDTFDSAILGEVVEHLVQPERVLAEAARVLKPGGRVIITTPFGFMPDADHKQTYFFSSFLPLVEAFFHTEEFDVIAGRYIGYVGSTATPSRSLEERATEVLRRSEQAFLAEQQRARESQEALREELDDAAQRYRVALDNIEKMRAQYSAQREAAQREATQREAARRSADRTIESLRRKYEGATRQIRQLRAEIEAMQATKAWRATLRVRRFRAEFLRGTWAERSAYVRDIAAKLLGRRRAPVPQAAADDAAFERRLEAFLEQARRDDASDRIVVMFSGTTYMREDRGNRPMRLAAVMRERGIPVLFSYFRFGTSEAIPETDDPLLFQSPIDKTAAYLDRIARCDFGDKRKVFVVSFPHLVGARWVNALKPLGWVTLYDCRDEWEEFHKVGAAQWYDKNLERYIVNNCDATLCTARALQEKMQRLGPDRRVELSPNALGAAFLAPENRGRVAPREGAEVIGYFGHLTQKWFAWDVIRQVARAEPGWTFEIIGHGLESKVDLPANVRLLGPKSHAEINRIAQRWRAGLIPFSMGELSDAVDPIKVYEYLALGLPVVCLKMAQIADYPYVFSAGDGRELRDRIAEAMSAPVDRQVIDGFLATNRWEDRVDQMLAIADEAAEDGDPLRALARNAARP